MKDGFEDSASRGRKPYRKPVIRKIPLRADEAVLAVCKNGNTAGSGTIGGNCLTPFACNAPTS